MNMNQFYDPQSELVDEVLTMKKSQIEYASEYFEEFTDLIFGKNGESTISKNNFIRALQKEYKSGWLFDP